MGGRAGPMSENERQWAKAGGVPGRPAPLRHRARHAGELMERLGSRAGIELRWVGTSARP
jgi:hypothetical protein